MPMRHRGSYMGMSTKI